MPQHMFYLGQYFICTWRNLYLPAVGVVFCGCQVWWLIMFLNHLYFCWFCLLVLSVSSYSCGFIYFFYQFCQFFVQVFDVLYLNVYALDCYVFFIILKCLSFSQILFLILKSTLSDINKTSLAFLWCVFA